MMKAWLEIAIGDKDAYDSQLAAYNRAAEFLSKIGMQLGVLAQGREVDQLSHEEQDYLREGYDSMPDWKSKGDVRFQKPTPWIAGTIDIELFPEVAPKAVENFRCLITGEKGKSKSSGKMMHYKGCKFFRIEKDFVCQTGDFSRGDGSGGEAIYSGGKFNDEKLGLKKTHESLGVVGMANSGKNSNTSQFYITLGPAPKCDRKYVVFGNVCSGHDIIQRINEEAASADGKPRQDVTITECGMR